MNDKEKQEFLTDILHALLDDNLKGKFMVEIKTVVTLDADNIKDAQEKGIEYAKAHPETWNAFAIKIEDLIHH